MHPYQALLQPFPPPPPTSTLNIPTLPMTRKPSFDIKRLESTAEIFSAVKMFIAGLLHARRERVTPSDGLSDPVTLNEYMKTFIMDRIANLFTQLQPRSPQRYQKILQSTSTIRCGLHCFTFHAPQAHLSARALRSPIVVLCPPPFYQQVSEPEKNIGSVSSFLHTLETDYETCVIFTDMQQLTIFRRTDIPGSHRGPQATHRTFNVGGNLVSLSVIIAAHIFDEMPRSKFPVNLCPIVDDSGEYDFLSGPVVDYQPDIPPDYEVFARCHRHSDFDIVSILCGDDLPRACQFLRWKAYVARSADPTFARVGDVVTGTTDGFFVGNVPYRPFYSPDPLPEITMDHIQLHRRPRDVISSPLLKSSSFSVVLLEDLTMPGRVTMCRTYRCSVSIDREDGSPPAVSSEFCIKLFDDRFLSFQERDDKEDLTELDPEDQMDAIWRFWDTAEDCIKREEAAYRKLSIMQGSLIPYYYGAHTFHLPGGHMVYGILMEHIPAPSLRGGFCRTLSSQQQIELIESVRHAVRVLQYSDVSQHDWHPGQILCCRKADGTVHGVLIDFSRTRQSYREGESRIEDDAGDALETLLNKRTGLDPSLIWSHWAPREHWDFRNLHIGEHDYSTPNPFKFVYPCITP